METVTIPDLPRYSGAASGDELIEAVKNSQSISIAISQIADIAVGTMQSSALLGWAYGSLFRVVTATRDANGAITTASIIWPDGTAGAFTTDTASTAFPGAIDAWHATYASSPAKTITQPAVTRDSSGAVIAQPAITIV